jgi:hypothetical protein
MIDLKQRFKLLDGQPVPDLRHLIDRRARHYAAVPGALGANPVPSRPAGLRLSALLAALVILMLGIGVAALLTWRFGGPVKHRTAPPAKSLTQVCPSTARKLDPVSGTTAVDCQVTPGTYSVPFGGRTLTFVISRSWTLTFAVGPGEDIHFGKGETPVLWLGVDPVVGSPSNCPGVLEASPKPSVAPAHQEELAQLVMHHSAIHTSDVQTAEVGGLKGTVLDVQSARLDLNCSVLVVPGWNYPMHQWRLLQGEKGRLYFLDVSSSAGQPTSVVIAVKAAAKDFDAVIREIEPIIASFVFTECRRDCNVMDLYAHDTSTDTITYP